MNQVDYVPQIPYGTRDFLPKEAQQKRAIEGALANLFFSWGYDEVVTPTFEYSDTIAAGAGGDILQSLFKFVDKDNRIVVLRPDMTTPIARVAATRLKGTGTTARLFYLTNVFRQEQAQAGRQCEFYQAGVELLGEAGPAADAEVIALAAEAMVEAGLANFQISLGQVDFINGILQETELARRDQQRVMHSMIRRDLVGLDEFLAQSSLSPAIQKLLRQIPMLHGREELLDKAYGLVQNDISRRALENLREIYQLLGDYGMEKYVNFDLGIIRDMDYYTGMVMEAYTPGLGFPLCGGGRYDTMLAALGMESPATGFALGIERMMLALERQGIAVDPGVPGLFIGWEKGCLPQAIRAARQYRQQGRRVGVALCGQTQAEAAAIAKQQGYEVVEYLRK
ncbi:MAG TPA: ATP phosphoribosyltransferase regulatory subunit [Patescibacteria group bacterium]|nr:ATP phosphoribosyltransferase regulatory subunit [Patescibacteria group bacterium]